MRKLRPRGAGSGVRGEPGCLQPPSCLNPDCLEVSLSPPRLRPLLPAVTAWGSRAASVAGKATSQATFHPCTYRSLGRMQPRPNARSRVEGRRPGGERASRDWAGPRRGGCTTGPPVGPGPALPALGREAGVEAGTGWGGRTLTGSRMDVPSFIVGLAWGRWESRGVRWR